jgi:hypothetical protein
MHSSGSRDRRLPASSESASSPSPGHAGPVFRRPSDCVPLEDDGRVPPHLAVVVQTIRLTAGRHAGSPEMGFDGKPYEASGGPDEGASPGEQNMPTVLRVGRYRFFFFSKANGRK